MKKFLTESFFFITILLSIILFIENSLAAIPNSYTLKRKCVEENASSLQVIVFGSSEAFYDIDPSVFDVPSCNLANSNQDIYFDSQLLAKYINYTPQLKMVVIPISYFTLEYRIDNTEEYWRRFFYYRYFGIKNESNNGTDIRNFSLIALYTPKNSREYIAKGFKVNLVENISSEGWFMAVDKAGGESGDPKANALRHTAYMRDNLFESNTKILVDMIDELKTRDIKVVLITLPVSKEYFQNIDKQKYQRMVDRVTQISRTKEVTYLNFAQSGSFSTVDFIDSSDHLNKDSALRFSEMIRYLYDGN